MTSQIVYFKQGLLIKPLSLLLLIHHTDTYVHCIVCTHELVYQALLFLPLSFPGDVTPVLDRPSWQSLGPSPRCWRRTSLSDSDSSPSARPTDAVLKTIVTTRHSLVVLLYLCTLEMCFQTIKQLREQYFTQGSMDNVILLKESIFKSL